MYLLTGIKLPLFERFYAYSVVIIKIFTDINGIPLFRNNNDKDNI